MRFTATLSKNGSAKLISVKADTLKDAKEKITRELSKPGRKYNLDQWRKNGEHVLIQLG